MKRILLLATSLTILAVAARAAEATENWEKNCMACHGKDGKGATKAGRMAGVKDFTDEAYQKSFTDDKAHASIKDGVKDDKGKEKMKAFAEKLTDDEINALVVYVRALKK